MTRKPKSIMGPPGIAATLLTDEFVLFEFPLEQHDRNALHPAERAVLSGLLRGLTNAQIAAERGRSARTIANQVRTIFARFGVSSRSELFAKLRPTKADE